MKKFSSNTPIVESISAKDLRYKVKMLMDNFLKIRIYGPINPVLQGTIKIEGQEYFLDAMTALLSEESLIKEKKILEKLITDGVTPWNRLQELGEVRNISDIDKKMISHILELDIEQIHEQISKIKLSNEHWEYIRISNPIIYSKLVK